MEQVSSTAVNLDKARVDVRHPMLAMVSMCWCLYRDVQ